MAARPYTEETLILQSVRFIHVMKMNRLLIVDEDDRVCRLLQKVARMHGFRVYAIDNPGLFEESCRWFKPDIIMLDVETGSIKGYDLLRYLASQHLTSEILLMSCFDNESLQGLQKFGRSLQLEINQVYLKPLDLDTFADYLGHKYREPEKISGETRKSGVIEISNR